MKVEQVYGFVNEASKQYLGETTVIAQDLSNIVDIGTEIFNNTDVDNYVKGLIDVIGKTIFVNRVYKGEAPSVYMDKWEWGIAMRKISSELPEARVNYTWELENNKQYPAHIFRKPEVKEKFFNSKVTFEVDVSFPKQQVKSAFHSQGEMGAFMSMLYNDVDKAIAIQVDGLLKGTINNFIADTAATDFEGSPTAGDTSVRAVNLLKLYRDRMEAGVPVEDQLKAEDALYTPEFIRFAVLIMKSYVRRLGSASRLFNLEGKARHTSSEYLHTILHTDFQNAAAVYLQSDTYNKEFTELPQAESVSFWQGTGDDYQFAETGKIMVQKTASGFEDVTIPNVVGAMFDRMALGVTNSDKYVNTEFTPSADFYTNYHKVEASYFNAHDENFVFFFIM